MKSLLNKRHLLSSQVLWTMAALTCTSQAALVAITVTLATKNAPTDHSIYRVALAGSFSDILALPASITIAFLRQRRARRITKLMLGVAFILLALSAAVLTMYSLARIWNSAHLNVGENDIRIAQALTETGFAVWVVAIASQIVLYTVVLWPEDRYYTVSPFQEVAYRESPSRLVKRSISAQSNPVATVTSLPDIHSGSGSEPVSSAFSAYSTSPRLSFRNSVSRVIRPVTSRTKLLFQHSFILQDPNSIVPERAASIGTIERNVGFQSWDAPALGIVSDIQLPQKFSKCRLDTIPGSGPVSPTNPLNGPFPGHENYPIRAPVTPPSSESSSLVTMTRPHSRCASNTDQSHIHPLFRSESPTPPPLASPGTVITASPFAGQVVSPEHRSFNPRRWHSTQRNRPEITSPFSAGISENK